MTEGGRRCPGRAPGATSIKEEGEGHESSGARGTPEHQRKCVEWETVAFGHPRDGALSRKGSDWYVHSNGADGSGHPGRLQQKVLGLTQQYQHLPVRQRRDRP